MIFFGNILLSDFMRQTVSKKVCMESFSLSWRSGRNNRNERRILIYIRTSRSIHKDIYFISIIKTREEVFDILRGISFIRDLLYANLVEGLRRKINLISRSILNILQYPFAIFIQLIRQSRKIRGVLEKGMIDITMIFH
jgi:hypothetical protein